MVLADFQQECYSSMANRYRQIDHATKTWPELRADVESMIQNNHKGTSKDPDIFSNRHSRRIIYDEATQPPQKYIRAARNTSLNHYDPFPPYEPNNYTRDPQTQPFFTRAASYPPNSSTSLAPNRPNCVNCGGDHAGRDCVRQPYLQQMPGHLPVRRAAPSPLPRRTRSRQDHSP